MASAPRRVEPTHHPPAIEPIREHLQLLAGKLSRQPSTEHLVADGLARPGTMCAL